MKSDEHCNNSDACGECDEITFLSRKILDLNKKLVESEGAKSRFLSLVANELNNPMTVLLGLLPHLKPVDDPGKIEIFRLIHEEALTLEFRIQNVIAAAEIESGSFDITRATVNLEKILNEAIGELEYVTEAKKNLFTVTNDIDFSVVTDPKKLHLIFKNLIANASAHSVEHGRIEIVLSALEGGRWRCSIRNYGKAPKVEYKPQIFTRFAEGPEGEHGFGLGLSVVREYVQALGGVVEYEVENGSVVFVMEFEAGTEGSACNAVGSDEFLFESFDDAVEF